MENIDTNLKQRDKAELIAIIKHMLQQQPDLAWLLKTPLPTESASKRKTPIDPELYRQQIAAILKSAGDYKKSRREKNIEGRLSAIKAIADRFAEQEDYFGAITIYEVLVTEVLEHFNDYPDEYIAFSVILNGSIDGLDTCFAGEEDNKEMREKVMRLLFSIYRFYTDTGMDLDDDIPSLLVGNTTPQERHIIAGWVHDALDQLKEKKWSTEDAHQKYRAFLLALQQGTS